MSRFVIVALSVLTLALVVQAECSWAAIYTSKGALLMLLGLEGLALRRKRV